MQRFYFHVRDGKSRPDEDGVLLDDEWSARVEAVKFAGALLKDHGTAFWQNPVWRLEVAGGDGAVLFSLQFSAHDMRTIKSACHRQAYRTSRHGVHWSVAI